MPMHHTGRPGTSAPRGKPCPSGERCGDRRGSARPGPCGAGEHGAPPRRARDRRSENYAEGCVSVNEPFWALAGRAPPRYRPPWFGCGSIDTAVTHWWSAGQWSNMRSMTAAFSADPERKYRAAVSMDACPSMAWTWAGSAPPWRRRVVCRQRWGRRPLMPASAPAASTTWVMPEGRAVADRGLSGRAQEEALGLYRDLGDRGGEAEVRHSTRQGRCTGPRRSPSGRDLSPASPGPGVRDRQFLTLQQPRPSSHCNRV